MANINSYAENLTQLTNNVNEALKTLSAVNQSMFSDSDHVNVNVDDTSLSIPSYSNVINRLERAENTVSTFVNGNGVITANDGTRRRVKVTTVPKAPSRIEAVNNPNTFTTDSNWIFENLMFPRCQIEIDLKDKIDDYADRVSVNRVILSADDASFYNNYVLDADGETTITYQKLISLLNQYNISYSEDTETLDLPISYEKYYGEFTVSKTAIENGVNWYYLDKINFDSVDENGNTLSSSYVISAYNDSSDNKFNYLRYNDSLYKIIEIDTAAKKVRLEAAVGYSANTISTGSVLYLYNEPYQNKIVKVPFGHDEINIVYFKAINEEYNILSKSWSDPISFITNDLKLSGSDVTFDEYYKKYVTDLGAYWKDLAYSNTVLKSAAFTPNAPVLIADDLKVVQINKQLEATLDSDEYNKLVREVESTKSEVNSLNTNITSYKNSLVTETSDSNITTLKNLINTNTEKLQNATQRYETAVNELNTLLNEAGSITYSPKYHVRGFFQVPEPVEGQQVIGFDIMYRYLHTDESGMALDTYEYTETDASGNTRSTKAVFSDWNMTTSLYKEQVWDETAQTYIWADETTADGDTININQIDIPIRNGEKLEIRARSISEAGYSSGTPEKSKWSNSVIIEFPENLSSNDSTSSIIESSKNDVTAVVLQQTMSAAGVYSHLNDTTEQYKHSADNIYFQQRITDENANVTVVTTPVSDTLTSILKLVAELKASVENLQQNN